MRAQLNWSNWSGAIRVTVHFDHPPKTAEARTALEPVVAAKLLEAGGGEGTDYSLYDLVIKVR